MASTFSDLKIELIGTGEQVGTWGSTTNTNLGTAVEEAIVGSADVSFSSADVTVTLTNTNGTQAARHLRLNLTGTSGGARQLILGSGCQIDKPYIINNGLADAVTVKNTTGTGVAVPAGKSMWVFNNGTNVVEITTHTPVSSGGTGASTLTANNVIIGNGTSAVNFVAPGTSGNVLRSNGTTWTSSSGGITSVTASAPLASSGGATPNISVTGTLAVANGGTGATTLTANNVVIGNGTSAVNFVAPGTSGNILTSNGTTWTSAAASGGVTPAASSVDNGFALFSGTGGATLKSSAAQDGFINGIQIGKNGELLSIAIGYDLAPTTSTSSAGNVYIGHSVGKGNDNDADFNVAIGYFALSGSAVTNGGSNVAIGRSAMFQGASGSNNVAIGTSALAGTNFVGVSGSDNCAIGNGTLSRITSGNDNTGIGGSAGAFIKTGLRNTAVGKSSFNGSGNNNTCVGVSSLSNSGTATGNNNTCLGYFAGRTGSPFSITTESNRVVVGNSDVTNAYIQVAWTVVSDGRDKEDIQNAPYGLNFVSRLRPVQYKWDKRSSYYETTEDGELIKHPKDGSKKEEQIQLGFIAQEVIALEKEFGAVTPLIGDDEQEEMLKVTETKFIPILVKAVQELTARLEAAEAEIALLKG